MRKFFTLLSESIAVPIGHVLCVYVGVLFKSI